MPVRAAVGARAGRIAPVATLAAITAMLALAPAPAVAQPPVDAARALQQMRISTTPELHPNTWEVGASAAATRVEGTTSSTIALRVARFAVAGAGRAVLEAELAHLHLGPLDELELGGSLGWLAHPQPGPVYPFLALAGGVRQEWLGSFRLARYPVGANVGVRLLAGTSALLRIEYRWRRVLNDPIADFTEQQVISGVSLLFGNRP